MALLWCWRCIPQSPASGLVAPSRIAAISTIVAVQARRSYAQQFGEKYVPKKGVHRVAGKTRQVAKKEKRIDWGPRIYPGERKSFRKRIILSNNNALEVALPSANSRSMDTQENIGKMVVLGPSAIDRLRTANAFKPTQTWSYFNRPAFLVRKETVDLCQRMNKAIEKKQALRIVVSGDKVAGKSMLMLQAMVHAYENQWIVLHIPEGQDLVTNQLEYLQVGSSEMWSQPGVIGSLLRQLVGNNGHIISRLKVSKNHGFGGQQGSNYDIGQLCQATRDPEEIWNLFAAVWYELTQVPGRPPILFALDGLSHVMRVSDYRTKDFKPIHAHDLAVIRTFIDFLSGNTLPQGGGACLGVMSNSNRPKNKSVDFAVEFKEALAQGAPSELLPQREPFLKKYDPRVDEALKTTDIITVGGVSKIEARSIMEYWAGSGMFRKPITERIITDTWCLGGHGIIGEMERVSLQQARP